MKLSLGEKGSITERAPAGLRGAKLNSSEMNDGDAFVYSDASAQHGCPTQGCNRGFPPCPSYPSLRSP
ncbi:hypothetical protein [Rhodanobacter sp. C03]|uniref:hypothetical protein n=1 Tax=Rhodanobacter sp. C03 TaxID=1945858 RepID=UPI00111589F9|nr:hypothetical protein [Rhodanobacter sp. C03]